MDDALFEVGIGERNVEMQAAPFQGVGDLPGVVAGQEDDRGIPVRLDRADLGNGHLEIGQDLEQQRFELVVRLVHLVEQEHATVLFTQRLQQRARLQELLGEEDVAELVQTGHRLREPLRALQNFIEGLLQHLCIEQLLAVLPLVDGLGLVETLVALQADER